MFDSIFVEQKYYNNPQKPQTRCEVNVVASWLDAKQFNTLKCVYFDAKQFDAKKGGAERWQRQFF